MKKYDKKELAAKMFIEADRLFRNSTGEMDYVTSILLSGAVVGISAPIVEESGGKSTHRILADISNYMAGKSSSHPGLFRETYNSLKHAGNKREGLAASQDMVIETDLKEEAARMLDAAKDDVSQIGFTHYQLNILGGGFLDLIQSLDSYT